MSPDHFRTADATPAHRPAPDDAKPDGDVASGASPGPWGWLGRHSSAPGARARLAALGGTAEVSTALDRARVTDDAALAARDGDRTPCFLCDELLVAWCGHPTAPGGARAADEDLARWIADAYRAEGPGLLEKLRGDFSLAVLDPVAGNGLLAVDRMGIRDLCWADTGGVVLFGPRADRLAADPRCGDEIDPQGIYDYLYHHVVPRPGTVFRNVRCLGPGEALVIRQGRAETRCYWRPHFAEHDPTPIAELQASFRTTLREAVERAAASGTRVGAFLSGGTDSSTLTGLLGEVTGEAPRTYSIGFDAPGYDEIAFARIAARRFGARAHEYYVTPADVAAAIPHVAAAFDQPYGNASVVPAYYCARLAGEDGVDVLLGGDGGDELFAGNARYARQWILSLYERVPRPLRRYLVEPGLDFPGVARVPPLRKIRRYVEQARLPFPARLETYNLLEHIGPARVFQPEFLAAVDTTRPLAAIGQVYDSFQDIGLVNRLLGVDFKFTLADDDLRKVAHAGTMAGVVTRFPFLDEAVVDLAARVPPGQKLRRTRLRHFFKEALRDYLPPEILAKEKHGFGLPFGVWLREDPTLRELARDSLDGLRARGIVRPAMIDELTHTRLDEHAGYFGTLTWVLMMLEQWFRAR